MIVYKTVLGQSSKSSSITVTIVICNYKARQGRNLVGCKYVWFFIFEVFLCKTKIEITYNYSTLLFTRCVLYYLIGRAPPHTRLLGALD
jgi:hypothetical protein